MTPEPTTHRRHRFPAEVISHAMWLYHLFSLSLRDAEMILAERGVAVTHESVRRWVLKVGRGFAEKLRRWRPKPRRLVTDGLRSYGVARREVLPDVQHRTRRYLNNRAENLYGAFLVKRSWLFSCATAASGRGPAVV